MTKKINTSSFLFLHTGKLTKDDDISTGVGADNEINNTSDNVEADG